MLRAAGSAAPLTNLDRAEEVDFLAGKVDLAIAQGMVNRLETAIEQNDHYVNARLLAEVLMLDLPKVG
jgi:hypothetical protein